MGVTWEKSDDEPVGHAVVEFKGGRLYRYENVSLDLFKNMCVADSAGKWVSQHLVKQSTYHTCSAVAPSSSDPVALPPEAAIALRLVACVDVDDPGSPDGKTLSICRAASREALGLKS